MKLNDAQNIAKGSTNAQSAFLGEHKVWPLSEGPNTTMACLSLKMGDTTIPPKDDCAGLDVTGNMDIGPVLVPDNICFCRYPSTDYNSQYIRIGPSKYLFQPQDLFTLEFDLDLEIKYKGDQFFFLATIGGSDLEGEGNRLFRVTFRSYHGFMLVNGPDYSAAHEDRIIPFTEYTLYHFKINRTQSEISLTVTDLNRGTVKTVKEDVYQTTVHDATNYLIFGEPRYSVREEGYSYGINNIVYTKKN